MGVGFIRPPILNDSVLSRKGLVAVIMPAPLGAR